MVYIDDLFTWVSKKPSAKIVGNKTDHRWCHMWADQPDELLSLAEKIGLKKQWLHRSKNLHHFDLTPSMRKKALEHGAIPTSLKTWYKNR